MTIIFCALVVTSPQSVCGVPSVGVKEGDWIEYNVHITGNPPPIHNVTWMRMEVLRVEDAAFPVNLTIRYPNGTYFSSIWKFNFTAGNTEGWIIIPSNLGAGDTFYDVFKGTGSNITVQTQAKQTVLGATRTVTYANDSLRQKEWDKNTGVFVASYEAFKNWTAQVNITAMNLWTPQILGLDAPSFYAVAAGSIVLAIFTLSSVLVVTQRRRIRKTAFGENEVC